MASLIYSINGLPFGDFGITVSQSDGLLGELAVKPTVTRNWSDYHGEQVDLSQRIYEPRDINLSCLLVADTNNDFVNKINSFKSEFRKTGTQRLMIEYITGKPLVYEVYLKSGFEINKQWAEETMYGTFNIGLREPEPVKRVVKFTGVINGSILATSASPINIYWGDGTKLINQRGNINVSHNYVGSGDKLAIITGLIDEITNYSLINGTTIWSKLQ